MVRIFTIAIALGLAAQAQEIPADLLARFRTQIRQTLQALPDYTCIQTVARSRRESPRAPLQNMDTLRLQVGLINKKEHYTWPDAKQFDDRELRDLVGRGIIGTGNFAAHVQHVFLSPHTQFTPKQVEDRSGRRAVRYDYEVPVEFSNYKLRVPPDESEVGVRGAFWVDLETLDLLRLEVHADEIAPELKIARLDETIDYKRTDIGETSFLLPSASELLLTSLNDEVHRNLTSFSACRQYRAESTVTYLSEEKEAPAAASDVPSSLPAYLKVELALDNDIDPEKAVVGDPVRALVIRPAKEGERVLVPEGAAVIGRLVRLEKAAQPFPHYVVGLEFHTLEIGSSKIDFSATMQDAGPASGLLKQQKRMDPVFTRKRNMRFDILVREKPRGEGVLHWDAKNPRIKRGLKMRWITGGAEE